MTQVVKIDSDDLIGHKTFLLDKNKDERSSVRRKKYTPAGTEFDGKCRQVEIVARDNNVAFQEIRLADYLFHNGEHWSIRTVFERRVGEQWVELDWSPITHSISVDRP